MESHCVYILYSEAINRFYIGYSANFDMRMEFHQFPESRKFTAKAQDWRFFLKFDCDSKKQALNIEKHIKTMKSSIYIKNLVLYPEIIKKLKEKYR